MDKSLLKCLNVFVCHMIIMSVVAQTEDQPQNRSLVNLQQLERLPALRDIVVKEGSCALIECNVTGAHEEVLWYNSKGQILAEEEGGKLIFSNTFTLLIPQNELKHTVFLNNSINLSKTHCFYIYIN